jgi:hypothetical protein
MAKARRKRPSRKSTEQRVAAHGDWTIWRGRLVPSAGRPDKVDSLFKVVAEKIPFACLGAVHKDMKAEDLPPTGIYLAHDSMGAVRYAGRGNIFQRLRTPYRAQPLELHYFSLYVIENKKHEREIETLVIRPTSHLLDFNDRKKRPTIQVGNVRDYEPGTTFYQRQSRKAKGARRSDAQHPHAVDAPRVPAGARLV